MSFESLIGPLAPGLWGATTERAPQRLSEALAAILCSVLNRFQIGTHSIFVGRVEDAETDPSTLPLLYANRRFTTITP